nr:R3H domain-containing protein 2-like [Tanacetum cinerariifolium]
MAGSVDDISGGPPESWEVADVDAAMSRLMMTSSSSKLEESKNSSSSSTDLTETPARTLSGGVAEEQIDQ